MIFQTSIVSKPGAVIECRAGTIPPEIQAEITAGLQQARDAEWLRIQAEAYSGEVGHSGKVQVIDSFMDRFVIPCLATVAALSGLLIVLRVWEMVGK